jgi:thioredoxin 1
MKKILHTLFLACLTLTATAADKPYNESADAKLDIKQVLAQTGTNQLPIILVFGGNWCPDCILLDSAMTTGASAPLLSRDFKIVKIDVGHFDKNQDIAQSYGVPLSKGVPAIAIISPKNEVLYVTREGELASARKLGDAGIYEFFKRVTAKEQGKK